MDRLLAIEAFVRVAETRSFAQAARQLGVAKSVITTRVRHLEGLAQAPLFHRTTRSVRLSEIGEAFLDDCADLVARSGRLVGRMREMRIAPTGTLRVHALPGFVLGHLGTLLSEFQDRHPGITLDVVVSDAVIDPVREGFDCAIQIFEPVSDSLVARRLFAWRPVFCASAAYLRAHGEPRRPEELRAHRLGLYSRYPTRDRWVFGLRGRHREVELAPALRTNSVHLLAEYAAAGAGVVCLPTFVAAPGLLDGRLRPVLTRYELPAYWLTAVYPKTHVGTVKLKLFLDGLAATAVATPPWDRALVERGLLPAAAPLP